MSNKDSKSETAAGTSTFGGRVRQVRKELDLTQEELARAMDISLEAMTGIETGRENADHLFLKAISEKYNVNLYYLLSGTGEPFRLPGDKNMEGFPHFRMDDKDRELFTYYCKSEIARYKLLSELAKILIHERELLDKEIALRDK
jgi:transcriptional regulator with XRE-family HTH domain